MNQLLKKLTETGKTDALKSLEALQSAAKELGFGEEDVAAAVEEFKSFPLSDDELLAVAGGWPKDYPGDPNTLPYHPVF